MYYNMRKEDINNIIEENTKKVTFY